MKNYCKECKTKDKIPHLKTDKEGKHWFWTVCKKCGKENGRMQVKNMMMIKNKNGEYNDLYKDDFPEEEK